MLTPEIFFQKEQEFREKEKVVYSTTLLREDSDKLQRYAEKLGMNKSQAVRYFTVLGMQLHKKRNQLIKQNGNEYKAAAEEELIRSEIIKEFQRRLELEDHL